MTLLHPDVAFRRDQHRPAEPSSPRSPRRTAGVLTLVTGFVLTVIMVVTPASTASAQKRLRVKARTTTATGAALATRPALVPSGPVPGDPSVADLFARINADRQANGLPAVRWDDRLGALAANWAQDMATNGFRHRDLHALGIGEGQYADLRLVSENIAMGSLVDTGTLHDLLMRSAGHRANTLDGDADVVGVGTFCDPKGQLWVAVDFGGDGVGGVPDNPNGSARATGASGGTHC